MPKINVSTDISNESLESITADLASKDLDNTGLSSVAEVFQKHVGFRLLTVTSVLKSSSTVKRIWTSDPQRFPVGGSKKLEAGEWGRVVMEQQKPLVCNQPRELRNFFFDHSTIAEVGCGAGVNLPVVLRGEVIGTVNIFHRADWFTPDRVEQAMALLAFVYTPIMLANH